MAFRIGRKYAQHTYPEGGARGLTPLVPASSTARFSANGVPATASPAVFFLADNASGLAALDAAPATTPIEYPALAPTANAHLAIVVKNNTSSLPFAVTLIKNGITVGPSIAVAVGFNGRADIVGAFALAATDEYDLRVNFVGTTTPSGSADIAASVQFTP
jgi:hypothetical protein